MSGNIKTKLVCVRVFEDKTGLCQDGTGLSSLARLKRSFTSTFDRTDRGSVTSPVKQQPDKRRWSLHVQHLCGWLFCGFFVGFFVVVVCLFVFFILQTQVLHHHSSCSKAFAKPELRLSLKKSLKMLKMI